ncbi:MAG: cyclic nucleotide-binding domain-containing protein [Deltaproteobacteria bacterium]|nr:cyclic nucleotide-binding domain-containing protein [Deltaproteobacteria bacterium]
MRHLREVPLFADIDPSILESLEAAAERRKVTAGVRVVEEGEPSGFLFVLLQGTAETRKREILRRTFEHRIAELAPGEIIGEVGFFDRQPRPLTVRSLSECEFLVLPYEALDQHPEVRARMSLHLAQMLRSAGVASLEGERRRVALGELVLKVVVLLCGYAVLLSALPRLQSLPSSSSLISLPIVVVVGWGAWRFVRNTGYPMEDFGLGWRDMGWSLLESLLATPVFLLIVVSLKWLLLQTRPRWRQVSLVQFPNWKHHLAEPFVLKLMVLYLASAIVQELTVRSALQAGLESFLLGRQRRWSAITISALMFSVNHLHMSALFAMLAFLPGIFWGWLFSRRRHVIGPIVSHFVVGAFVFFVLGVWLP